MLGRADATGVLGSTEGDGSAGTGEAGGDAGGSGAGEGGAAVSVTLTLKEPEAVFPAPSLAVQVTTVVPRPKTLPEGGVQETATEPSTASSAVAV